MSKQQNEKPLDTYAALTDFVTMLDQLEDRWNFLYDEIGWSNQKQNDLVHDIENNIFGDLKRYKKLRAMSNAYLELHDLRKYRRELKEEQELLEPIYRWYNTHKSTFIELHKVKDAMSKIIEFHKNWVYIPRTSSGANNEAAASRD